MIHYSVIRKQRIILYSLVALLLLTIFISMGLGFSPLSFHRLLPTLFGQGTMKEDFILYSIRIPRIAITLLAGMGLALAGAILQGITRNELADPGILGINAGAGFAVSFFVLYFSIDATVFAYVLPLVAFGGAILTALCIYWLSSTAKEVLNPIRVVLMGIGFSFALSSMMVIMVSSTDRMKVDFIAKWLAGNIWGADWPFVWALLPWLVILIPFTLYKANRLNLLTLSEPVTIGLGMSLKKERIGLALTSIALTASAVSVTGGISFIGLMAPHIGRALVGPRHQLFLPITILLGGWLLLTADTIGRNIVEPAGVAAGIMVSLIGAPYFIYLLLKK